MDYTGKLGASARASCSKKAKAPKQSHSSDSGRQFEARSTGDHKASLQAVSEAFGVRR